MSEITHRLWAELLRDRGPRFQFVNAIKLLCRSWSLKVEEQMSEFEGLVEQESPLPRRYARALSRNAERADDLVQETLNARSRPRSRARPSGARRTRFCTGLGRIV